jgi:predicted DNA binding protein
MSNTELAKPQIISLEIENHHCKLIQTLQKLEVTDFQLIDVRSLTQGLTIHLVKISPEQTQNIPESLFTKIERNSKTRDQFAWYESDGCEVCNSIVSAGAFLVSGRSLHTGTRLYKFLVPSHDTFKDIISKLEELGLEPNILRINQYSGTDILTEKQERALWFAHELGFFEFPRKINTASLAERLGIAPSTLSEILRRGLRRLVKQHFEPR